MKGRRIHGGRILGVAAGVAALLWPPAPGAADRATVRAAEGPVRGRRDVRRAARLPPTYIFPLYNGANSGNDNITYLQPLMWLPLYWFGHPDNAPATINYPLSMAAPPVYSNGGRTVTMKLKH